MFPDRGRSDVPPFLPPLSPLSLARLITQDYSSHSHLGLLTSGSFVPGDPEGCVCRGPREDISKGGDHLLGLVVPFRDRFEELMEFAPHIHSFLTAQNVKHKIFVINQVQGVAVNVKVLFILYCIYLY